MCLQYSRYSMDEHEINNKKIADINYPMEIRSLVTDKKRVRQKI